MERMQFHQHKLVLTITTIAVAIIGAILGVQMNAINPYGETVGILSFAFLLILMVINFIGISIALRTREELHMLHEEMKNQITKLAPKRKR